MPRIEQPADVVQGGPQPAGAQRFSRLAAAHGHLLRRVPWLHRVGWAEAILLGCGLVVVLLGYLFIDLSDDIAGGDTRAFDEWAIRAFRRADNPAVPIGPAWLREMGMDFTALGGHAVIILVVGAVAGFLALRRQWRVMVLILAASVGAFVLSHAAKAVIGRPRPDLVPHLREVTTLSFPSGHATVAAAVYLTLGAVLAQVVHGRWTRTYCVLLPMLVVALVGVSRVYLGVHYPTDVLGGWALGLAWALVCWAAAYYLKARGLLQRWRGRRGEK